MELTRRSDYACRMIRAAYECKDTYISVSEVADRENIPYAFARSIQHDLVRAGLLKTVRGAKGGLALACDTSITTLLQVLEALQGPLAMSPCTENPAYCEKCANCEYRVVWCQADSLLRDFFASITLDNLFASRQPVNSDEEAAIAEPIGA